MPPALAERLNVIALISGGKDSFFSLLHCIEHGHRIVALANLFPSIDGSTEVQTIDPNASVDTVRVAAARDTDLNSFMYQTVGHEVIPLYAAATGLPLYRQPINGSAVRHERDYDWTPTKHSNEQEETESMLPLLRFIMERHPEANAVSAGAILSTYQRTRVESIALRLGLTPLAYLWKCTVLPPPVDLPADDAQLLYDMAAAGLEARIIKVASAGLSEDHLWETVSTREGAYKVKQALRRFGSAGGAVVGEGGEFETIVVDGPAQLFNKKIEVGEESRNVVNEGGGTSWLAIRGAKLGDKETQAGGTVRVPALWDAKFKNVVEGLSFEPKSPTIGKTETGSSSILSAKSSNWQMVDENLHQMALLGIGENIEAETQGIVDQVSELLTSLALESSQVSNTVVVLRRMADFPKVNKVYGELFTKPNPPSRVTISCGDLLPEGHSIAIYLTVDSTAISKADRQGLHVQSRSYWAPANIGPYSQAVGILTPSQGNATSFRMWSVAGQIPLIPGTMLLPTPSETSDQNQIALSLQHLWRIGSDLKIQFWTSGVAYFARSSNLRGMERNAQLAGQAWRLAHGSPEDDDNEGEDDGPDPWDLKYNPQYMSLAATNDRANCVPLPDWSVLTLRQQNEPDTCIPPFFAIEVEELPRQSAVEWHAHLGISQLDESSVEMIQQRQMNPPGWQAWHFIARSSGVALVHTVMARSLHDGAEDDFVTLGEEMELTHNQVMSSLVAKGFSGTNSAPYLVYLDKALIKNRWSFSDSSSTSLRLPTIPCHSIWSGTDSRYGVVCLYRTTLNA